MRFSKYILLAGLAALPVLFSGGPAEAGERFCREYTKSVRIGGVMQSAYGTACLQPDGSWEMVSYNGNDDLYDDIREASYRGNGRVVVIEQQPVTYWYRPYRRPSSSINFVWYDNDRPRYNRSYGHGHGWGNDWDRGRGRGRGHDNHRDGRGRGHNNH